MSAVRLARADVFAVVTSADLPPDLPPIPCRIPTHGDMAPFLQHVLARDVVRYVGEPIAVVVAASRAIAEDAAEDIAIDWERARRSCRIARRRSSADAPKVHAAAAMSPRAGVRSRRCRPGFGERRGRPCARRFAIQRHSAMPLETRGLLASYDRARRLLEVFGPTKVPHTNRALLATMLRMRGGRHPLHRARRRRQLRRARRVLSRGLPDPVAGDPAQSADPLDRGPFRAFRRDQPFARVRPSR